MKRAKGFRVKKRDGRSEWLRATKLARSIGMAIAAARGESFEPLFQGYSGEDWRTSDLTAAVLTGLRDRYGANASLPTEVIAQAVQQVLLATGFPQAAEEYARVAGEQVRREEVLLRTLPPPPPQTYSIGVAVGFDTPLALPVGTRPERPSRPSQGRGSV